MINKKLSEIGKIYSEDNIYYHISLISISSAKIKLINEVRVLDIMHRVLLKCL